MTNIWNVINRNKAAENFAKAVKQEAYLLYLIPVLPGFFFVIFSKNYSPMKCTLFSTMFAV